VQSRQKAWGGRRNGVNGKDEKLRTGGGGCKKVWFPKTQGKESGGRMGEDNLIGPNGPQGKGRTEIGWALGLWQVGKMTNQY